MQTFQEDFAMLKEYKQRIRELFQYYCLCSVYKVSDHSAREDDYFMRDIHPITLLEISKLGLNSTEEITKHIQRVEESYLRIESQMKNLQEALQKAGQR